MQPNRILLFASITALCALIAQSSSAEPLYKGPPPPPDFHWDGLFASFSAGGTLTHGSLGENQPGTFVNTSQSISAAGVTTFSDITTGVNNFVSNPTGNGAGAVFTFAAGYNFVWRYWIFGVQPEASFNLSKTRLVGTGVSTSSGTTTTLVPAPPTSGGSQSSSDAFTDDHTLQNDWTISPMAAWAIW